MRRIVFTSLLALGLMATTYAQDPAKPAAPDAPAPAASPASPATPASPDPAAPAQAAKADEAKPVVVTGCIGGGPAAFTLTNAAAASATAKPGETPIGTAGISSTYDLTAKAGVDLAPHVGHKVEITGTPMAMTGTTGGAVSTDRPAAGGKTPAAKLTVSAVKMVSASCP